MSIKHRLVVVIAGSWLAVTLSPQVVPAVAHAEPAREVSRAEAKRLLRSGAAAYERRDYETALASFQAAMAAFPSPRIQYNLGQTFRQLHRPVEATVAFETFLKESDRVTSQQRSEATAALKELETQTARVTVLTNVPDVEVEIDGVARGKTPLPAPVVVAPGKHQITLARDGYVPLREAIAVTGGEERKANLVIEPVRSAAPVIPAAPAPAVPIASSAPAHPTPPLPTTAAPPLAPAPGNANYVSAPAGTPHVAARSGGSSARNYIGGALLATTAALAAGGAVMLGASWARYNEARDGGCDRSCPSAAEDVDSRALWSKILFGAAAVTGVAGATVFLAYPDPPPTRESGQRSPPASGLVLVGQGRF
jgi:hypothetical protein